MISVTILTKNNQASLKATLESVQSFKEVLVVDTGSTDGTLEIARQYPNVRIHSAPFTGFGPTHNLASSLASYEWILSLDSDEILSPSLIEEIHLLPLNPHKVYSIQRHNYYNGKWIRWCGGWYPDRVVRLYHRQKTSFSNDYVHEKILLDKVQTIPLIHPIIHTPYREISDFLSKMQIYSTLFAEQNRHKKKASITKALLHSWYAFWKSYLVKRGFLGGKEGLIISLYNAHTAFYKYLKLLEINQTPHL